MYNLILYYNIKIRKIIQNNNYKYYYIYFIIQFYLSPSFPSKARNLLLSSSNLVILSFRSG